MDNNKINLEDKIFIAGGTGMVGSAVYREIIRKGYGNKKYNSEIYMPSRNELNLMNDSEVRDWFNKFRPDVVILAAAKVGGILANKTLPYDFIFENLKIQNNIIVNAWKSGVKRLLFLGSSCIYPKFAKQPIREDDLLSGYLEETNEFYAIAKISGIKLCESLRIQHGFDAISLMPTNLYGKGDNYHPSNSHVMAALISKFINAKNQKLGEVCCWGSGSPLREFLYVDDLAEACLFVLEKWDLNDKFAPLNKLGRKLNLLNVGSSFEISIKELANKICKITQYDGKIIWDHDKPDGTPRKKLDTSKLKQLGWEAKTNLDDGIKKTIKIYESELKNGKLKR